MHVMRQGIQLGFQDSQNGDRQWSDTSVIEVPLGTT